MVVVRIVLGALVALLVMVLAIPAIALVDLVIGGSGLGLCPNGLGACETSSYTILELALILIGIVTILGFGIAGCVRFLSRSDRARGRRG
ncbi:MAG: hypothetical protein KDB69_10725 [Acidimicrobiia bacterium]|nr:hypothetical protein [Acidimicrobiia bacterium]